MVFTKSLTNRLTWMSSSLWSEISKASSKKMWAESKNLSLISSVDYIASTSTHFQTHNNQDRRCGDIFVQHVERTDLHPIAWSTSRTQSSRLSSHATSLRKHRFWWCDPMTWCLTLAMPSRQCELKSFRSIHLLSLSRSLLNLQFSHRLDHHVVDWVPMTGQSAKHCTLAWRRVFRWWRDVHISVSKCAS